MVFMKIDLENIATNVMIYYNDDNVWVAHCLELDLIGTDNDVDLFALKNLIKNIENRFKYCLNLI